jgi:hypothetical protein
LKDRRITILQLRASEDGYRKEREKFLINQGRGLFELYQSKYRA